MAIIQANKVDLLPGMSLAQVLNPFSNNGFVEYVRNTFNDNVQLLKDVGSGIMDKMQGMFNFFNNEDFLNAGRNLAIQAGIRNDNTIHSVTCENINEAGLTMAGYIMANPTLYDMYQKYRIDGYGDMFYMKDTTLDDPRQTTEYMQVMDGMVKFEEDGYTYSIFSHSGDELTLTEKLTVLEAWDCVDIMIDMGIDPTSQDFKEL